MAAHSPRANGYLLLPVVQNTDLFPNWTKSLAQHLMSSVRTIRIKIRLGFKGDKEGMSESVIVGFRAVIGAPFETLNRLDLIGQARKYF